MALSLKNIKYKILSIFPILLLLFVSFNGNSIIDFNFFSINLHFIIVYYWALRDPDNFGYGFIFLSGIINDVVYGLPFGVNALCLLLIAAVAAYVRVVAVRVTLVNDWISFVPALLFANFIYFLAKSYSIQFPRSAFSIRCLIGLLSEVSGLNNKYCLIIIRLLILIKVIFQKILCIPSVN